MNEDPLEKTRKLMAACQRVADKLGLKLVRFSIVPATEAGETDHAEVVLGLTPESVMSPEEREGLAWAKDMEEQFNLEMTNDVDRDSDKVAEAQAKLAQKKKDAKGWLGQ